MPRPPRNQLSPWIEKLILSYSSREQEEEGRGGRLKAHVIGVGEMSQSQAQNSDGLTGLLFLSDGFLQIPAVLTAAAWERLQEQEDRECFASLLNATACIHDYQLRFHMTSEQTRCRFFLSVGELATTAAGPVRDNTPCCTTASSVRLKICETWRALLSEEAEPESQRSQCGFDLSELLGEWQHDCVQAVLDDVRDRLAVAGGGSVSPQPSTSSYAPLPTLAATGWDVDRLRFKGVERFTVPVKCLLVPEDGARQPRTSSHTVDTRTHSRPEPAPLSVDVAAWRIPAPAAAERVCGADEIPPLPVDDVTRHVIESDVTLLSNPWDIFPPPCTSSSSEASPDASTTNAEAKSRPGHAVTATSARLPVHIAKESQPTSAQSKDFSDFPPYQKPPHSTGPVSTPASLALPFMSPPEPAEVSPPAGKPSASDQETCEETTHRKAKRKRSEAAAEAQTSVEPPSWLVDTQAGSEDGGSHRNGHSVSSMWRKTPSMHSSGRPFSYTYQVTGQNLQDFSGFTVSKSLLHWAVKYLLPKQEPVTSDPGRGHVTVGSTG
ncbi:hypothetical protein JOB18_031338 [Solea senegalensis]|uniref:Shelterin complex subunit TPP1/Est3 domain-containing protein n=1 Tax=Solea senegalensis TaxID=28829 RepID=A0AAV6PDP9_SOLSE|nr:uncharacterized protein LOC122760731 isoform X1 [Solea senegalensis]KAG7453924.1 hypothetical protein JOB18_031338 [Solea senegalensis]